MAREPSKDSPNHQVLIRLTRTQAEVLSALAFLRGTTGTEIVRTEIAGFLENAASSERVQRLVRERREYEAEESRKLRPIRPERTARPEP